MKYNISCSASNVHVVAWLLRITELLHSLEWTSHWRSSLRIFTCGIELKVHYVLCKSSLDIHRCANNCNKAMQHHVTMRSTFTARWLDPSMPLLRSSWGAWICAAAEWSGGGSASGDSWAAASGDQSAAPRGAAPHHRAQDRTAVLSHNEHSPEWKLVATSVVCIRFNCSSHCVVCTYYEVNIQYNLYCMLIWM